MGETRLLAELVAGAGGQGGLAVGTGDDAAVWEVGGRALAITTDSLVEGVDFRQSFQTPREVGLKAWGAAASDLAAMGFRADLGVACLICSADTFEGTVLDVQAGLVEGARRDGAVLAGGDVSATDGPLTIAVTVVGSGSPGTAVRLAGARPQDLVVVTGRLGGAAAALLTFERGHLPPDHWRQRLAVPRPRLAEGQRLLAAGAHAMTDISDGLLVDSARLAQASSCRLELWADRIPLEDDLDGLFPGRGLELAAGGGEDYELLACLPQAALDSLAREVAGGALTVIGQVTSGEGIQLLDHPGGSELSLGGGFRHF